jgi:outer membrane protein TolC
MKTVLQAGLFVAHVLCAGALSAQAPRPLSVEEAQRLARSENAVSRRAVANLSLADVREQQAFNSVFKPQFGSGITFTTSRFRRYTAEDFAGQPLENPYYAQAVSSSATQSIGMSMELFSHSRLLELRGSRSGVRQARASLEAELHRVDSDVERRYYRVLMEDDAVALEERLTSSARERLEVQRHRLAAGMALPVDVLGAEIEVLEQESRLEHVRGEARKARLLLLDALGMTDDVAFELTGAVPDAFDPSRLDAQQIITRALTSSPRVRQAAFELENSELQRRRARSFRWPTVRGSAGYARNRATSGTGAFYELFPKNWGYDMSLQVSLPVPILRFNENLGVSATEISHARLTHEDALTRAALERQVRAALIDLGNGWRNLESAGRRAELSSERARLAREQHRHGTIAFIELQQYNDREAQAQRGLLDARIAFTMALLALEELLGGRLDR